MSCSRIAFSPTAAPLVQPHSRLVRARAGAYAFAELFRALVVAAALLCSIFALPGPSLHAQEGLVEGDWVRVRLHSGGYAAGHLVETRSTGLLLRTQDGRLVTHPTGSFRRFDVLRGTERRFAQGFVLGVGASALAVGTAIAIASPPCSGMFCVNSFSSGATFGAILPGIPFGLLAGLVEHDRWEEGVLPGTLPPGTVARVLPTLEGGIRVGVSIPIGAGR